MKIYILNILPISLKNNLEKLFRIYKSQINVKYEVVSKEFGIITIEEDKITYIESTFNTNYEIIKNYTYNDCNLLIDKTNYCKIPLISQFPVDYIYSKIIQIESMLLQMKNTYVILLKSNLDEICEKITIIN